MPNSQICNPYILVPSQNLSLLLGRGICSGIIPTENINYSRITRKCKEKPLDTSEKIESQGYLQNSYQKWVSVGCFESGQKLSLILTFEGVTCVKVSNTLLTIKPSFVYSSS